MSGTFTLLELDGGAGSSNDTRARVPNVTVEITRGCRQSLEWDGMYARHVISLANLNWKSNYALQQN